MASNPSVLVPYATLHPTTEQVMKASGLAVEFVHMPDDDAYRRELRYRWTIGETFVIVEQDIVPWPGAIEELIACPCKWGTYGYRLHGGIGIAHGLGCCKITSDLIQSLPDVWWEPERWDVLDQRLFFTAQKLDIEPHLHRPPVVHLSEKIIHASRVS